MNLTNLLIAGFANIARKYLPPVCAPELCEFDQFLTSDGLRRALLRLYAQPEYEAKLKVLTDRFRLEGVISLLLREQELLVAKGGGVIDFQSEEYPALLRHISDPPPCLFLLGAKSRLAMPRMVAVIGARRAARLSEQRAQIVGTFLAQLGFVVVSGGAFGCDVAAHLGAMTVSPGQAVVVQAGGLGELYPAAHGPMFARIVAEGGALISERLFSDKARRFDFPIRNRLIAGIAETTVVIESTLQSGSMTTVGHALAQGRTVLTAPPPDEFDVRFSGNRQLIADGSEVLPLPPSGLSEWRGCEKSLLIDSLSR